MERKEDAIQIRQAANGSGKDQFIFKLKGVKEQSSLLQSLRTFFSLRLCYCNEYVLYGFLFFAHLAMNVERNVCVQHSAFLLVSVIDLQCFII